MACVGAADLHVAWALNNWPNHWSFINKENLIQNLPVGFETQCPHLCECVVEAKGVADSKAGLSHPQAAAAAQADGLQALQPTTRQRQLQHCVCVWGGGVTAHT
jgi:hypothetical protein